MSIVPRVLVFVAGAAIVLQIFGSAIRTVILPRGTPVRLTRWVFLVIRTAFGLRLGRRAGYEKRDQIMALYGPVGLMTLLTVWLFSALLGYALMFWAVEAESFQHALALSGSSLLTLGFVPASNSAELALSFAEAATGLVLLALAITYLPSIYGTFSRRELEVAKLEVRAWRDFCGWRVNYDAVLLPLAGLVLAPMTPWSSDRSAYFRFPGKGAPGGLRVRR